ncbi:hypothetical protein WJX74_001081 [Apatococcus lobatus]|uniref:Helicase-associated domain-containing protein n=1 Tax=Apatococcus lobatus TaxID=904363 RepID=A0AAW1Q4P1_9CHLO
MHKTKLPGELALDFRVRPASRIDFRTQRQRAKPRCKAAHTSSSSQAQLSSEEFLLHQFWKAKGVFEESQRSSLVNSALKYPAGSRAPGGMPLLPEDSGLANFWNLTNGDASSLQAEAVSNRLIQLQTLLHIADAHALVWMVLREPRLLTEDLLDLTSRILQLRLVTEEAGGMDITTIVAAQPALLLQDSPLPDAQGNLAEQLEAWQHGVVSDADPGWDARLGELRSYVQRHGDAHVGFRDGDPAHLVRWAAKQRHTFCANRLSPSRAMQLLELQFEFGAEVAEWQRWFNQLAAFQSEHGHCNPSPLVSSDDMLMLNWCSVQRIARRAHVLLPDREEMLTVLGFDWTGADALS